MKFNKLIEKNYPYSNELGKIIEDIPVLKDEQGDIYLEAETIEKCSRKIAYNFYTTKMESENYILSSIEVCGIIHLTGLNKSQFSEILGLTKSAISHIINGKNPSKSICVFMLNVLANELMFKNYWKNKFDTNAKVTVDDVYLKKMLHQDKKAA